MKKIIGRFMLWIAGWKFECSIPVNDFKKSVLVCAPHTTNWDFYYCLACFWSMGIPYRIMIKDAYTKPWFGFIFKELGCIGVNRGQHNNLVDYSAALIKKSESMSLINTPEGTRSRAKEWKKGFYFIAKRAGVPVVLAYADYKNKIAGISKVIHIGDKTVEEVFNEIEGFYKPEMAKYPDNYNPQIYIRKE
ncbi:1-acyl-sn-glycerol-3-phosphate acyltransferase [Apibacter raozihei]|uniref:1-acyl-sn-glycerol-3-phosphate acyltransferase n=1 Tax=Apibacter raozihei TaxID=2500547 RepID=UPI000FE41DDA|nr:1-acyl-sn-glycerol-3-phosphate acyltransferase [Apibacter raozihei]